MTEVVLVARKEAVRLEKVSGTLATLREVYEATAPHGA